jgi:ribosomal protein S6
MAEDKMPAAEAKDEAIDERNSYELAFHVLPTVAEGEVAGVYDKIKALITQDGEIISDEAPERIDLAYPIVKSIEAKNRKFTSAYFGWVRFKLDAEEVVNVDDEVSAIEDVLRHIVVKLTPHEETHPFRFHEDRKSVKMVEVVNEKPEVIEEVQTEKEENVEVSEKELDESLEKITESTPEEKIEEEENKKEEK